MYKTIDMETYPRKAHFDYFRSLAYPYVGVTVDTDVTELKTLCHDKKISFYLAFLHAAALAADSVPAFRQRIRDGGIIEYDHCDTSHTESAADGTYRYCTLSHHMPPDEYLRVSEEARRRCRLEPLKEDSDPDSLYFISALPWMHYSALIQPVAGGDESNPRITWGAFSKNSEGRLMMPVTVLIHHALGDGRHMADFYEALKRETDSLVRQLAALKNDE